MWTTSTAMDIIPLSIASHFMCKECSLDLVFFMQIDSGWRRQKWHRVNNMGLVDIVDAVHTFLIHLRMDMDHINSDGFLSIITQHSVSCANRVLTPNLTFCGKNNESLREWQLYNRIVRKNKFYLYWFLRTYVPKITKYLFLKPITTSRLFLICPKVFFLLLICQIAESFFLIL